MYIPCCPLTEANATYLVGQREAFADGASSPESCTAFDADAIALGLPGPDFPSGKGESNFMGRLAPDYVMGNIDIEAQRAMGLANHEMDGQGIPTQERRMLEKANEVFRFSAQI